MTDGPRVLEATPDQGAPDRLDRLLARAVADVSRTRLQGLIRDGRVTVDGAVTRDPSLRVGPGARLRLEIPEPEAAGPAPEGLDLAVVYEDEDLIVIDKPAGLVVHPAAGHESGTLVNALLARCGATLSGIGGVKRPGIVHRLDKDTTGLLVVAKNDLAHQHLAAQFADHGRSGPLERAYLAVVWGTPRPERGTIDAALGRSSQNREKMSVVPSAKGRRAVTHYSVEQRLGEAASLLRCRLETGRTHQIRVHLAHLGHPLLGDRLYGSGFKTKANLLGAQARDAVSALGRQALHGAVLGFAQPRTGVTLRFESPLPADMRSLATALASAESR